MRVLLHALVQALLVPFFADAFCTRSCFNLQLAGKHRGSLQIRGAGSLFGSKDFLCEVDLPHRNACATAPIRRPGKAAAVMSVYGPDGFDGFNVMWDGHDAFVSEQFRCEPKLLAHHVKKMMKNGQIDRARQLLVTFGEEPRPDLSEEQVALRLLRLTYLSTGLRKTLEGEILGIEFKEEELLALEDSVLVDDIEIFSAGLDRKHASKRIRVPRLWLLVFDAVAPPHNQAPEGMRSEVTRKTATTPNARSTPKLRRLDEDPYDVRELNAMKVVELKALLGEAGLKKGGKKAELVARLKEAGW